MSTPRPDLPRPSSAQRRRWAVPALVAALAVTFLAITLAQGDGDVTARPRPGGADALAATPEDTATEVDPADPGADPADPGADAADAGASPTLDMARRDPEDPLTAGPVDAPVVMVVYSDYQCPFCAVWSDRTLPAMAPFVEAGDLRIEWRDVNVFGPDSARAARAAYAAGLQGRFWDLHDALFEGGEKPSTDELTDAALLDLAASLGLDTDRFAADVASPEVSAAVQANAEEGASIGAFSTPTFLIGGTPVVGAQPTEVFVAAVEDALARAAG